VDPPTPTPKIELHVHFEGTVLPARLLEIARRNEVALAASSVEELRAMFEFRDFAHFIEVWTMTTHALRTERDFREIVADYAQQAAGFGVVYLEGIFSPAERVKYGPTWDEVFAGFCDGAQEARERFGVEVRLTPDIPRDLAEDGSDAGALTVEYAERYRDRGVVGVGLGGLEAEYPPEPFARVFARARASGLGSVPHAGEAAGVPSIRGALDALGADRLRHGIRAIEDPKLVDEIAERGIVLDVCPISNVRTGIVRSLSEHPLPALLDAGVGCTLNTDDPALFDTDLEREHEAARAIGVDPLAVYRSGVRGALCDEATRARLREIGDRFEWDSRRDTVG
jgi:aminodeoxyfutalosine deaminase